MMTFQNAIDADSHIIEPSDLWVKYSSTKDKSLALSIVSENTPSGPSLSRRSFLTQGGRKLFEVCGSVPVGLESIAEAAAACIATPLVRDTRHHYQDLREALIPYDMQSPLAAWNPQERLKWMDGSLIDKAIITPTWGAMWERYLFDKPEIIRANMDAYNRWVLDFCSVNRSRLIPVIQVSLIDPVWASDTIRMYAKQGVNICALRPVLTKGKALGHDNNDSFWATLQEHNMAAYFHISGTGRGDSDFFEDGWYDGEKKGQHNGVTWSVAGHVPMMLTLTNLIRCGVFQRHPKLRVAVVEHGTAWIDSWLRQFDSTIPLSRLRDAELQKRCPQKPSSYFKNNVWVTPFDSENIPEIAMTLGEGKLMFSTDYPHPECSANPVTNYLKMLATAPLEMQAGVLRNNALNLING